MKEIHRISKLLLTFFFIIALAQAVPTPDQYPDEGVNGTDTKLPLPLQMNCYGDRGETYINDIPHTTDCKFFGKCTFYNSNLVHPQVTACPENLKFSMKTCNCEYPDIAECFDPGNSAHQAARFNCACEVRLTADGGYETIGPPEKCFNQIH